MKATLIERLQPWLSRRPGRTEMALVWGLGIVGTWAPIILALRRI